MKVIELNLKDLKPYERNPRKNDEAVQYVVESIKQFGFKVPIVVDKNNVIIAGHTRYKASKELGLTKVPCVIADDLTDEQVKAFRIADNKTGEKAGWDLDLLKLELPELEDFDFTDFGFGEFELSMFLEDVEPEPYDNEMIEQYSVNADKNLARKRVIITYKEENEELVKELLGVEKLKVVYTIEELIDEDSSN